MAQFPSIGQPSPADALPAVVPLAPHQQGAAPLSSQETHPNAKRLASELALALTTYEAGEGAEAIAARLPVGGAAGLELARTLHHPGTWSRGRIIYPQLGGIRPQRSSVMVVVEQMIGAPEGVRVEVRTLDVRLALAEGRWRFERLASAGGTPLPPPEGLSPEALAVLNDHRIELPDSARWDIFAGRVSPVLLGVMARLAEVAPYGVVTLATGHPWEIFGTDRQSDHTRGLAVDIYRVGERLVIDDRAPGSTTHRFTEWARARPEVARIGSPWSFAGPGAVAFTDPLHQDHLHIAVHPR